MEFTDLVDLASEKLGGAVLFANDEFFAPKENLLQPGAAIWIEGKYTERGKWMDGWETMRRRSPRLEEEFDWCVVRLGAPGRIRGVTVDTSFFRGNFPSHCSIDACSADPRSDVTELLGDKANWKEILPKSALSGDSQNNFTIDSTHRATHVRLKIFPDGGVARLRVHGDVLPDWDSLKMRNSEIDLAAVENGGTVPLASDMFFGHRINLIMPGLARDMSDGWESQRRRGPGHDWCIIKLGAAGTLKRVEIDTSHFKGHYPESCSIDVGSADSSASLDSIEWRELLSSTKLQPHTRHTFVDELADLGKVTHARLNIFPDGGVSRLRLFGRIGK
ncbi:MAG: allantoicase [Acidobacteriota bacterium]